ncbi:hypothetical protein CCR94_01120 [Rhodoblastus sphagnicola]|uniref:Cytochrome c domain-containing protein n=2 Tax=Rhodoblastus sphagnicola TaxID=333368 RepID=A0A2S6NG42_9HYPH|nr:hypothetical protein CCR94_01120 [Rhodoblastus sphagnicola]
MGRLCVLIVATIFCGAPAWAQAVGQWRDEKQLYAKTCKFCHGTGVGPGLWGRAQKPDALKEAQASAHRWNERNTQGLVSFAVQM